MKTSLKIFVLLLAVTFASCSRSNDDNVTPGDQSKQVKGDWYVSLYTDSGKDETSDFSGYNFSFIDNGSFTATTSTLSFTGNWYIGDKSGDDSPSSNKLVINITGNKQMEDVTDDWLIIKITDTEIWLKDDNAASMEEIHFTRKNQ